MKEIMSRRKRYFTDFLFPQPTLKMGMGSVLNIAGDYFDFNYSLDGPEADRKAIESDWGMIGQDLQSAVLVLDKSKKSTLVNNGRPAK